MRKKKGDPSLVMASRGVRRRQKKRKHACLVSDHRYDVQIFDPADCKEIRDIACENTGKNPDNFCVIGMRDFTVKLDNDDVSQDCYRLITK